MIKLRKSYQHGVPSSGIDCIRVIGSAPAAVWDNPELAGYLIDRAAGLPEDKRCSTVHYITGKGSRSGEPNGHSFITLPNGDIEQKSRLVACRNPVPSGTRIEAQIINPAIVAEIEDLYARGEIGWEEAVEVTA